MLGLCLVALGRYATPPSSPPAADREPGEVGREPPRAADPAVRSVVLGGSFGEIQGSISVDEGRTHLALGRRFLEFGDYYSAASHLAAAREGLGDRAQVCELLARAYDKLNMTLDLQELLPCLAEAARERPSASRLYERLRRQVDVEEQFDVAASDHFVASFPATGASAHRIGAVLDLLEGARSRIESTTGIASNRLIPVVIYEDNLFEAAIDKPHWASGLYDGKIRVHIDAYEENPAQFEIALTHEYVHALTHEYTGTRLPNWLREGLADVLARSSRAERNSLTRPLTDHDPLLELDELSESFSGLSEDAAVVAYRQSYWMVRNLADEGGWEALADVIRDLRANPARDFEASFREIYAESPEDYLDRFAALGRR